MFLAMGVFYIIGVVVFLAIGTAFLQALLWPIAVIILIAVIGAVAKG